MPGGLYVLPMFFFCICIIFSWSTSLQKISESTKFSRLLELWKGMICWSFILRSLKGRCQGSQILEAKLAKMATHLHSSGWRNVLQYRHYDFRRSTDNTFSALCRNLVRFGPVTPQITVLESVTLGTIRRKSAYHAKYLRILWTDLHQTFTVGRHMDGND